MKFSVVTPCRNAEKYIGETIESVLSQTALRRGSSELQYIVCDGASEDATAHVVESFRSARVKLFSGPDRSMYDALAKGLAQVTGDVVSYLNAGDLYEPHAFDAVEDLFRKPGVQWLTGLNVRRNEASQIVRVSLPFRYRRRLFEKGCYAQILPFVQQESTFWSRSLLEEIDLTRLATFRYAGDYYLWLRFSRHCELHIVETHLGSFRVHRGQLSSNRGKYLEEVASMTAPPSFADRALAALDRFVWLAPPPVKAQLNPGRVHRFDHRREEWR
jgi:glycosyltransferase involved in cell wall biosynthesis